MDEEQPDGVDDHAHPQQQVPPYVDPSIDAAQSAGRIDADVSGLEGCGHEIHGCVSEAAGCLGAVIEFLAGFFHHL
jgi:hypothetical protein